MRLTPESFSIIEAHEPVLANAIGATSNEVYLGTANGCMIVVHEDFVNNATPLVLTVNEGRTAAEALGGLTVIAVPFMAWFCLDSATSDAFVRQPDAATFTLDAVTNGYHAIYIIYVPTDILIDGYDWIQVDFAAGNGANLAGVTYILDGLRYQQETPPSAI